jgi:hypothetical protein
LTGVWQLKLPDIGSGGQSGNAKMDKGVGNSDGSAKFKGLRNLSKPLILFGSGGGI